MLRIIVYLFGGYQVSVNANSQAGVYRVGKCIGVMQKDQCNCEMFLLLLSLHNPERVLQLGHGHPLLNHFIAVYYQLL